jgi:uncharacterized protein
MEPSISMITLAVEDLERSLHFYRDGLGLSSAGIIGTEFTGDDATAAGATVMFELHGGFILALYPRSDLTKDANTPMQPRLGDDFSIGHLVATKEDVDVVLAQAKAAGGTLKDAPHDRPGASTLGISATLTDISGRSSRTRKGRSLPE